MRRFSGQRAQVFWPIALIVSGQAQNILQRAFDHQEPRRPVIYQHRDPPPLEVKRHLVELLPAAHVYFFMLQNGVVQRAFEAGLEVTVEIRQLQHPQAVAPHGIQVLLQADPGFSQRARLVCT